MSNHPPRIGPYRLLRRIGRGGIAEVFLAEQVGASGFCKRVAIKRILPELSGHAELERALIAEARLGARLTHRNLVSVLGLAVDGGSYYAVLEHVDGGDLAALASAPLSPALALLVAEELALALDFVHRAVDEGGRPLGLIHRDVSPSNVLVSVEGEVKLADFGLAKATLLADVTHGNLRKGTFAYMSPEQVAGEPLDATSDQFSLAILLAELLTGRRPFDAETAHATMENIRRADRPDLADVPAPIAALLRRCLAPRPSERFATAELLRRELALLRRAVWPASSPDLAAWVARGRAG
jgi:eukaryotic-like serine/threonine-protein kinase